jgi:predicted metal-dependent hydrolase
VSEEVAAAVRVGVRLFNRGRYFEAHEHWEAVWQTAAGEDRIFLESLVQIASGLHLRVERGGTRGTEHLLARALVGLDDYRPAAHGVDVERLTTEVGAYLDWLRAVRRPHRWLDGLRIPRIHEAG